MKAEAGSVGLEENQLHLTDQERCVLASAAEGLTDKESSRRLRISIRTVQTYWQRMKDRTGLTRCQLVMRYGQIHLEESIHALKKRISVLEARMRSVLKEGRRPVRPGRRS